MPFCDPKLALTVELILATSDLGFRWEPLKRNIMENISRTPVGTVDLKTSVCDFSKRLCRTCEQRKGNGEFDLSHF